MALGLKRNPLTDAEIEHLGVSAHLAEELQARHDAIVKVDEFGLRQLVDVNRHIDDLPFQRSRPGYREIRVTPNVICTAKSPAP
jgi:hypothetical protein